MDFGIVRRSCTTGFLRPSNSRVPLSPLGSPTTTTTPRDCRVLFPRETVLQTLSRLVRTLLIPLFMPYIHEYF